jgi:hypothetical protein
MTEGTERGQTTIDFTIGISVFLGVIIFVFVFAPGILTPFTVTGQSEAVTVDRTADYLAQDALGSPDEPYILDRGCTVAFFDRAADEDPDIGDDTCRYDDEPLNQQLGLDDFRSVNVTLRANLSSGGALSQLYWDETARELATTDGSNHVELTIGDPLEGQRSTTTATRIVTIAGEDVTMEVVVS